MTSWFLLLILSTPGHPGTEHYVTLQAPTQEVCETMRDEYFAHGITHVGADDEDGTTMVVIDKKCEPAVES